MRDDNQPHVRFNDRRQAGYELASELERFAQGQEPLVLGIPRGGVPVAAAVAEGLNAPLDLAIAQRIQSPAEDEGLGAITPDRTLVINRPLQSGLGLSDAEVEQLSIQAWAEAQRLAQLYRAGRPYPDLRGKTVVIVDVGITTGYTMMAAAVSARKLEPARVVVAVPVASIEAIERIRGYVDELLSLEISAGPDFSIAAYYANYPPVTDQEVAWITERFWAERPPQGYAETF